MPRWLAWLCASRLLLCLIFTAYSGVLPFVHTEWRLSATQAATIQSAWHVGYLVSLFAAGMLADRFGARRTYLDGGVYAAVTALGFALLSFDYWSALVLYGIAGLCSGTSYTPGLALIAANTNAATRGRAMGWFLGASSLGYATSLAAVAALGFFGSWRAGLILVGAATVLGALLARVALANVRETTRAPRVKHRQGAAIIDTLRDKKAMACNWAYAFHCWELFGLWAWLPAFLAAARGGASATSASWGIALAALTHVVSVAGSIGGGMASDRFGRVRVMAAVTGLSLACSFTFGWFWASPLWVLAIAACLYNLLAIADSSVYSTALAEAVPAQRLGAAYSVRSVLGFGAGAVSPVVFGAVLDYGQARLGLDAMLCWALAWSSVGVGALLGPVMIVRFGRLSASRH
jgi:MFS family permease